MGEQWKEEVSSLRFAKAVGRPHQEVLTWAALELIPCRPTGAGAYRFKKQLLSDVLRLKRPLPDGLPPGNGFSINRTSLMMQLAYCLSRGIPPEQQKVALDILTKEAKKALQERTAWHKGCNTQEQKVKSLLKVGTSG
jgi:hypothetical protein